jgi:hypothetical protein
MNALTSTELPSSPCNASVGEDVIDFMLGFHSPVHLLKSGRLSRPWFCSFHLTSSSQLIGPTLYMHMLGDGELTWPVINSTKTLELIPNFLNFFQRLYAPVFNHVTLALILAELPR